MFKKSLMVFAILVCFILVGGNTFAKGDPDFLIQSDRQNSEDRNLLLKEDFIVIGELGNSLFILGDKDDIDALHKKGYYTLIIDSSPSFSDYYMIGTRPDSDLVLIKGAGEIIYSEENILLLRVPAEFELSPLYNAKVFVAPLKKEKMKISLFENEIHKKLNDRKEFLGVVPLVQKMVNSVNNADTMSYWTTVVNNTPTGTRYSTATGCDDAATYCYNTYAGFGLTASYQNWSGTHAANAIGTITGAVNPTKVYITISHLDDLPSSGAAPGADDNASGVVAGLEAAKIMSCYAFKNTVKFIACTGEEAGLLGSEAYAAAAETAGEDIQGVISFDMPGWEGDGLPASGENLDLNYNSSIPGSQALGELFAACATDYGTGLPVDAFNCPALNASDHYPFWTRGWAAVCGITDNEGYCSHAGNYPDYHTVNDTIANCGNPAFFYSGVKATLATLAELGEPFKITLDKTAYACTGTVQIIVGDRDLNTNASTTQTVNVSIWSTVEGTPETVTLTEDGVNSMIFKGTITLTASGPVHGDGLLSVASGSTITASYTDAVDCDGALNVAYTASAPACTPPIISNVTVTNLTAASATITWTTNVPTNSRVTYGTSTPPATNQDDLTNYVTSHSVTVSGLTSCTPYYFSVTSNDVAGNTATDNNGGSYYSFTTPGSVYAYGPFTAESGTTGWTLTNQWHRDTCKAHGGTYAMKAGSTTCPGTYNASTTSDMTLSANITLGAAGHGYHLKYWEYYQTESGYDYCRPQISTDGGTTWTTLGTQYAGTGTTWTQKDFDLAAYTGSTVRIRFEFYTDGSQNYEGWYVDDIEVSKSQGCSAELVYQSRTMTEACNGTGSGGGNAILEPGEDGTLAITMVNSGSVSATGVSATLTSTTTGVTVTTATANFPNIATGGTGTSLTNYVIHVDPTVTCVTAANFTLHSTSTQNPSGNDSYFTINVGQAGGTITDFSQNFTSVTPPALPTGWTESHTSGNAWLTSASYYCTAANGLYYPYNSSSAANSYVYTPGIALTSGVTYTLNFNQKVQSATWPENFEVKCGTAATPAGQTITILASASYTNTTCTLRSPTFTVPTTGTYYISWHCTSAADMYYLIIDDVNLTHTSSAVCNVCSTSCTNPSTPTIASVNDINACSQSGVRVTFTAGSPSTSNALVVDGSEMATGITSPYDYNPGNTASHSYVVRTYNTASCHTDSTATARADANNTPSAPTAGNNGPICAGATLNLTASTISGATYAWTGPNGFTSAIQNPSITNATTAATGTYSVTATVSGCTGAAGTTTATVNAVPAAPTAGNNGPICAGATLNLTASTISGATYAWTGPNGFTSAIQNPSITNATTAATGTYSVTATVSGCTGPAGTTTATVNAVPAAPTAGNNGPVCVGDTLNLTASTISGATYAWTGPNGFTSAIQNPSITNATTAATGTYSVTATVSGCTGPAGTTTATVNSCAVIPGEVASGTNFTWSGQTMNWTADSNATGYRVYRGLLSNLSALCDATNDFCLRNDAASTSLDVTGDDPSGQSGRCYYYLITGYSGAGEGPAGTATCGARQVNSSGGCS